MCGTVLSSRTGPGLRDDSGRGNPDLDENTTPANDTLSKLERELIKVRVNLLRITKCFRKLVS